MIVTFTPNPSIDATLSVPELHRGGVHRATSSRREAGGKGINVSTACAQAGHATVALALCSPSDPFVLLARGAGVPLTPVPIDGTVRTNTTLAEPDGTTTKVNETGPTLTSAEAERAVDLLLTTAIEHRADAVVLAGSLPPGAPASWYATLARATRAALPDALIAVDTSDSPLVELGSRLEHAGVNLLKPNAFELAQLTGADGAQLEAEAAEGDFGAVAREARSLLDAGLSEVLVTLGASGACLVTAAGAWAAAPPPVEPKSTVGAGDSALAGYVMARVAGLDSPECLRRSVAYGSAAAGKAGTGIPAPDELDLERTHVFPVTPSRSPGGRA